MPVSPLCRIPGAVTGSGLLGGYTNPSPNSVRATGFDAVLTLGEMGVDTLAAAAVVGALLQLSSLLQCSDFT